MRYQNIQKGIFLERPNRFIAHCLVDGRQVVAHVKNTGRCKELLVPGAAVYLDYVSQSKRRTPCDLVAVEKAGRLINMDSQAPNQVIYEALSQEQLVLPDQGGPLTLIQRESVYHDSRFDFYIESGPWQAYIEVKGVTLEEDGVVLFPDAPTQRGVKHLHGLMQASAEKDAAYVIFLIQMSSVDYFTPNAQRHPAFAQALREAAAAGVHVLAYDCRVAKDSLTFGQPVEVRL
jgi:sugar fermentation stimulation protein A